MLDAFILELVIQTSVAYVLTKEVNFMTHHDGKKYSSACMLSCQGCSD